MMLYKDYYWKNGVPKGILALNSESKFSYKIVSDPYFKHISIEKYEGGFFYEIVYDSYFIDFRHLVPAVHLGWEKTTIEENDESTICLIRNHHDRIVYKEVHSFTRGLCTSCKIYSPHGWLVAFTKISYTELGDPKNQLQLFDANNHLVLTKCYEWDPVNRVFSNLISEEK